MYYECVCVYNFYCRRLLLLLLFELFVVLMCKCEKEIHFSVRSLLPCWRLDIRNTRFAFPLIHIFVYRERVSHSRRFSFFASPHYYCIHLIIWQFRFRGSLILQTIVNLWSTNSPSLSLALFQLVYRSPTPKSLTKPFDIERKTSPNRLHDYFPTSPLK